MSSNVYKDKDLLWDDFKNFLYVARLGQIQLAAKILGVDHSTVSRKLVRLEETLGIQLFDRAARRLHITDDGRRLMNGLGKVEAIFLREIDGLSGRLDDLNGNVRVGVPQGIGTYFLASRMPLLLSEHPELELELCALPRNYSLAAREADVVITMDRPSKGSLRFKKLTDYSLGLFATQKYLDHHGWPKDLEELEEHEWCGYIDELLYTSALDLRSFGATRVAPRFRSVDVITQIEAVVSGQVMGILPCFIQPKRRELVRVMKDEINIKRPYFLVVHEDLANLKRVRFVMDRIEQWVHDERSIFLPE